MKEQLEKFIYQVSPMLDTIPYFNEFVENTRVKNIEIFDEFIKKYGKFLSSEDILKIKILTEKFDTIGEQNSPISFVSRSKIINDESILKEFKLDWRSSLNGKYQFRKAEIQHYKTITEKIVSAESEFDKYLDKYQDSYHPYICSKIALSYLYSKKFDVGLAYLQRALMPIFTTSNIYWHNHLAMYGCTWALHEVQHIAGRKMYELMAILGGEFSEFLNLLYLYLSRCIEMSFPKKFDINSCSEKEAELVNFLSIRGDIVHHYKFEFANIWFGVNPIIQVMSDKYWAYEVGTQLGLDLIVEECRKEAFKLYQHGGLIPNSTGGLVETEESSMLELIERGKIRSLENSRNIYSDIKLLRWLNKDALSLLMQGLRHVILTKIK